MHHDEIRALLLAVQAPIDAITTSATTDVDKANANALGLAWKALETHLAIGPAAQTRDCPKCHKTMIRNATLCGHCWNKSEAPQAH